MLEAEKGNRLQIVHKALLGDVTPCPCSDPAPFPAGDSQKFLEGALIMGHPNPALDGANKPARATNKSLTNKPFFPISSQENLTHLSAASLS